jgi:hypothetical protein
MPKDKSFQIYNFFLLRFLMTLLTLPCGPYLGPHVPTAGLQQLRGEWQR